MLYLVDANVLIQANEDYYPLDRVPPFWDWLIEQGSAGNLKMPYEIWDEIAGSAKGTPLRDWVNESEVQEALILDEEVNQDNLNTVIDTAYAPDLTDDELIQAGRDPFLIGYATMGPDRAVVTKEVSKNTQRRGKRRVPDACNDLGVLWMPDFRLYRELDFKIT